MRSIYRSLVTSWHHICHWTSLNDLKNNLSEQILVTDVRHQASPCAHNPHPTNRASENILLLVQPCHLQWPILSLHLVRFNGSLFILKWFLSIVVGGSTESVSSALRAIELDEANRAWLRMRVLAQVWRLGKEFLSSRMEVEGLPIEIGGVVSSDNSVAWLEVKGLPVETSSWGDASVVWLDW